MVTGQARPPASALAQAALGVDAATGEIVAHAPTDGAYDSDPVHQAAATRQPRSPPEVVIPSRADAVPSKADPDAQTPRDRHIQLMGERGRIGWQRATGYGPRHHAEVAMGRH